jgi:hypothetical protein
MCQAHNPKVTGSNPVPATKIENRNSSNIDRLLESSFGAGIERSNINYLAHRSTPRNHMHVFIRAITGVTGIPIV